MSKFGIINLSGLRGHFKKASYAPENKVPLYFAISKKSPLLQFKSQIATIIKELVETGQIEEIMMKYR